MLFALRLRHDSVPLAWLAHILFNAQPILSYPLIAWLAPLVLAGRFVTERCEKGHNRGVRPCAGEDGTDQLRCSVTSSPAMSANGGGGVKSPELSYRVRETCDTTATTAPHAPNLLSPTQRILRLA
jgi:hypothetical protein